jgi:hypothetical protein
VVYVDFVILNSRGSVIRAFEDEGEAQSSLRELSAKTDRPLYLMPYDDEGLPAGRAVMASDLGPAADWMEGVIRVRFKEPSSGFIMFNTGTIVETLKVTTSRAQGVGKIDVTPHEPARS